MNISKLNIAVVGGGVAGITASHILSRTHHVTLFERNSYVGGHTNTIIIPDGPDAGTPVDTGFIVMNDKTYPLLHQFLRELNVPVRNSDMSFSFYSELTGFQYSSNVPDGLLAQRRNIFSPVFWGMVGEILKFFRQSRRDLKSGILGTILLGDYLARGKYSENFIRNYLVPMGAAIWSASPNEMLKFPAQTFVQFFENHGLLTLTERPQWQSVVGGSHSYVKVFLKQFPGIVKTDARIQSVRRVETGIEIRMENGSVEKFDRVVIAAHADEALKLLADPSADEKRLLGAWTYSKNHTVLHTDESVMPPNQRAWASWNYVEERGANGSRPVSVSYDMNRLQGLKTAKRYFVTLNRLKPIEKKFIIKEIDYTHPTYMFASLASQKELPKLNGIRNTYFCGSYFGYGFHEDAVRAGVEAAEMLTHSAVFSAASSEKGSRKAVERL